MLIKEYPLKRPFDWMLAILGLALSSVLWLIIPVIIYMDDKGPVLFLQERCGRYGKPFRLIKFRTMSFNQGKSHDIVVMENDPRITRFGKILRDTAIDELPSLINIMKGDMSFVGPRAEPYIIDGVNIRQVPCYEQRIIMRPGLTGIAQLYASRYITLEDKFAYDTKYLDKMSLRFDINLILLSFWVTFHGKWEQVGKKI